MQLSLFERCRKKKLQNAFCIWILAISAFYAFVLTPLYQHVNPEINVVYYGTVYPILVDFLMQFTNYLFYWGTFAYLVYSFFRFELRNAVSFWVVYVILTFLRYFVNFFSGYYTFSGAVFPRLEIFLSNYLPTILLDIAFDCFWGFVLFCGLIFLNRKNRLRRGHKIGELLLSNLPFSKLFALKNPIQQAVLWAAAIPAVVQIISQIILDFTVGAPSRLVGWLWMIFYYLLHFVYLLVGFFVIILFINRFYLSEEKARFEYEQPLPDDPV